MNASRCLFPLVLLLLLPFSALPSQPKGRIQSAVITDKDGLLCAGVSNTEESRRYMPRISVMDLYENVAGRETLIWQHIYDPVARELPAVSPGDCLAHDVIAIHPFPQLAVGRRYAASIAAAIQVKNGRVDSRYYQGYFCMVERDGVPRVHQVLFDKRREVWAWDACAPTGS